jgi:O-antigen ligase
MSMNLKLKDLWYWVANFALLGSAFLSMYANSALPMLAVSIPLVILDRAYVVPLLLFIAAIEGSFKVEDAASQAESTAIMLIGPLFAYDFIRKNGRMVPYGLVLLYIIFGLFVVIGMFTYASHPQIQQFLAPMMFKKQGGAGIYVKMFMKVVKLVFFFLYLKVLINEEKELFYRALSLIKDMAPYLTILVALNMVMFGVVSDKFETIHFGESHHGDFSANMNALGVYIYIAIFENKSSWFKRVVGLAGLGALLFVIMELASRNGLLTFILLGIMAGSLGLWNRNWGFKVTIVAAAIFAAGAAVYLFKDSPTVERFIYQTEEEGGGDRLSYWSAGLNALQEEPLFGLGGDETASMYAVGHYDPEVPDHVMHNTFIEFAVEYGLIGLMFYLVYVSSILYHGIRNFFFAVRYDDMLLAAPTISYIISIFAGLFISRVWESTLWYDMTLIFGIYILWRKPVEDAIKKRKYFLMRGMPDPLNNPALALHPHK